MLLRKALLASVMTLSVLAYSSIASVADERSPSTDSERLEASKVAQSVVESYVNAYDKHDPKAISMLFVPDGVLAAQRLADSAGPRGDRTFMGRPVQERRRT